MKLIRRRQSHTPPQKALDVVRLALRGLVAQRVARKAFKGYKLAKKLPLLIAGGALAAFVAKRARGGGDDFTPPAPPTPPAPAPPPSPAQSAPAPELTPDLAANSGGADVPDGLAEAGDAPANPAAAAEGGSDAGDVGEAPSKS